MIELPQTPFKRRDLEGHGLKRHEFFDLVNSGKIRAVLHEVYVDATIRDNLDLRLAACALVLKPGQVIVDRTAAWLHGIDTLTWAEHDAVPPIDVCGIDGREPVRRAGVAGCRRDLARDDIIDLGGLEVTTPLRTALDLGCRLRRREAYAALCQLTRSHGLTPADFESEVPRFEGRRGVVQLRELARLIDPRYESPREAWVWLAIRDAGLATPTPQLWVDGRDGDRFRLDFAYEMQMVAVEYDGEEFHQSDNQGWHDYERRRYLMKRGWRFLVVRRGDFISVELERWLAELKYLLNTNYDPYRW